MNSKPKYSTLVKALKELNATINYGLFNALSAKEVSDQPCYVAIRKASDRAEKLLKRVKASSSNDQAQAQPPTATPERNQKEQ